MSFWQYQSQQEASFQQAVLKNVNERNAQLQKQLDNVVREGNREIGQMWPVVANSLQRMENSAS